MGHASGFAAIGCRVWLGHSNLETTKIYAQATMEIKRKVAKKLEDNESSMFKDDMTFKYADDD